MRTYDEAIAFLEEHGVWCDPSSCPEDEPWLSEVGEYVCDELDGMAEYDGDDEEVYDEDDLLSLVDDAKAYEEDARQRYEADMEDLDESKSVESVVNESVEPFCAAMNHSSPESVFIVKASKIDVRNLGFDYITELQPILPGKKTLIMNNDEDIFPVVENTTQEEFEKALTAEFEENKKAGTYVDDSEAFPFFSYDPEDFGSAEEFVGYVNDFIANSEVDNDSSSQYRWYTSEDVLSLDELKDEWGFDEDDIINESVEPFCEDYKYFNADDFEKEEIYGYEVDPNSDEYKAHEEIVNKIFKPKHIEELDWSVVTSADGDGYVYKEIVHFLDRDDWDKLQSVEDSREYKKLTPNIGDYEIVVSYHLDQGIDEFLDPAISFYAKSLGELSYGDDEEEEEDAESLDESASLTEGAEKAHWRKLLDILDKFNIDYGIDDEVDWNPEIKELVSIDGMDALALCSDGIYYGEQLMPWEGRFDAMKLLKALYDEGKEYGQYPSLKKIFDKNV